MEKYLGLSVSFIYLLAAIPFVWLGLYAWRKRPAIAVTPFAWAMLGMAIWSFTYSLEIFFPTLPAKLFITKIEYIGIVSIPVFLLLFSLEFTGKSHLLSVRNRLLLWTLPLLILLLVWTNESHHLMWDMATVTEIRGIKLLDVRFGLFFWIQVIFSYILVIVTSLILIMEMIQRPGLYRIQLSFVVVGILIPWVGSLIFVGKINPIPNLDITPILFLPTALGLSWAVIRYRLLEIVPLEHLHVLKNMKDGVIVVNSSERVLYINPLVESLLGRSELDVIGQPLSHISEKYGPTLKSYLTGAEHQAEMLIGVGDQAKVYEVIVSPVSNPASAKNQIRPDNMIVLHDITQRKETESDLSRRESIMSAISLTAEQFLKDTSWEHHVPTMLGKIGQAVNVSRVHVFMNYMDHQQTLHSSLCYEWAAPGITTQSNNPDLQHVHLRAAGFSRWEKGLSQNLPIHGLIENFPEAEQALLKKQGSISMAVMPIFVENEWWGFIIFDECTNNRYWTDVELKALRTTASLFGSAETRARTEQKLLRRQRTLELLQDIVQSALRSQDLQSMAQSIVHRFRKLINADSCFITQWDEVNKIPSPLAAHGPSSESYLSIKFEPGKLTFAESAFKAGSTLIVDDIASSTYADISVIQKIHSKSMIVIPLISGTKRLGTVFLLFNRVHHFQQEEISISQQAGDLIALAFEKFLAVQQAQQRADTSETLRKASAAISETLEMKDAVTQILEQLNRVVPYDSASVQILVGNELEIIGGSGFADPESVMGLRFPIPGDNPNTIVMETEKPFIIAEIDEKYGFFNDVTSIHIRSWLGVPLIYQNRIIGLLAIDSTIPNHFTQDDINIATTFADQVAVALENARIFEEAQDKAITDPLTGLYNRRGLFELGRVDFARAASLGRPFSGIMVDIDHFKQINDTYGHAAGDQVLRELANRCKSCVRGLDYVNRYGGEEILILLPETNLDTSRIVAERVRAIIANKPIHAGEGLELNVTASVGVAQMDEHTINLEMLITRADEAMYIAKHKGRNCVAVSM